MKKIIVLLLTTLLSSMLISCSGLMVLNTATTEEKQSSSSEIAIDIRQIAFEQLSSESKDNIKGTWKDANLSKTTLKENMGNINDKSYIGKEVYTVDFPTKSYSNPNNMVVFVSIDNKKIIGYGYID